MLKLFIYRNVTVDHLKSRMNWVGIENYLNQERRKDFLQRD